MKTYQIPGTDLEQINFRIANHEAAALEFVDCKPSSDKTYNDVSFRRTLEGEALTPLTVVIKGTPPPAGSQKVWEGKMNVDGNEEDVEAYR